MQPSAESLFELLVLVVVVPLVAGWWLGLGAARALGPLRARWPVPPAALRAAAFALLPLLSALLLTRLRVGLWDAAWMGLCAALGAALATIDRAAWRRQIALAAGSTLAALALAEALSRALLPPPPAVPPLGAATLQLPVIDPDAPRPAHGAMGYGPFNVFGPLLMMDSCGYLHPARYPGFLRERVEDAGITPPTDAVLHLGDSMTMGQGVALSEAFPARLAAATPGLAHVNAGVASTSTDYQFSLLQHWLPALDRRGVRVRAVVLNLYYNDLLELDLTLACCDDRALVTYGASGARDRCPSARWPARYGSSLSYFLTASPTPYVLRAATPVSHLARHVHGAWARWVDAQRRPDAITDAGTQAHLAALLAGVRATLAARGVPLAVVLQPPRYALESPRPATTWAYQVHQRLRAACAQAGIEPLDAYPYFQGLVQRDGVDRWFRERGDIHLTPAGHQALADWLRPQLAPQWPSAPGR